MNEFLNSYSTSSNALFTSPDIHFPERSRREFLLLFGSFIGRPEYQNYLHLESWKAIVDLPSCQTLTALITNLKFCRDVAEAPESTSPSVTGRIIGGRNQHFGPRNTGC